MNNSESHRDEILDDGYTIINNIYSINEINNLLNKISQANHSNHNFRKTNDLFAIRQFLKEVPEIIPIIFNDKLKLVIDSLFGNDYFVVKAIYFDKPGESNWFVAYHQDLTISVDKKIDVPGYYAWTSKQNQFAVQPPIEILERNFTIRIHLDDTDKNNGALKVIPTSHNNGIQRAGEIDFSVTNELICNVSSGGIMIMRPLLLHASNRTTNDSKRRVIHIEFSNSQLPNGLKWSEKYFNKFSQAN